MTPLILLLLLPAVGALVVLAAPRTRPGAPRMIALGFSLASFLLSLALVGPVRNSTGGWQLETNLVWIRTFSIRFHIGVDGLGLWLVLLSTLLTPIAILASWRAIQRHVKGFYALLLLLEVGLIGVFIAADLFLFYVFWEVSLVPMYFLIGIWGHERRIYAAVKFFLYTMAGSVLMLAGIVYLYNRAGTFDYTVLMSQITSGRLVLTPPEQMFLFLAFFLAFAIKVPLFPLHTWLPDAHVEAPTAGSIMLASVMLKMGAYGLLRFCLPLFPNAARACAPWIMTLAIIGIIYGALVAMVQPNMKKLVAYSSVSHLGFVVLGIFTFTQIGMDGAVYQMLAHGISTGALFLLVGYLYERRHSLEISDFGGIATPAPNLAAVFLITLLASIGLPALSNFVGEFLVLQGSAQVNIRWSVFAAIGVILSACYMLWLFQRAFQGETPGKVRAMVYDLRPREWVTVIPLIVLMVWLGTVTATFLPPVSAANAAILQQTKVNAEFLVNRHHPSDFQVAERGAAPPEESAATVIAAGPKELFDAR